MCRCISVTILRDIDIDMSETESNLGTSHYKPQGHQGSRKIKQGLKISGVSNCVSRQTSSLSWSRPD